MKNIVIGILAHVDAGKTTLSEAMLYQTGAIRNLGRVDHKNAFLDTIYRSVIEGSPFFPAGRNDVQRYEADAA